MRSRYSAAQRADFVTAWKQSGLTQEVFAAQNQINLNTLRNWIYRRGVASSTAPVRFLEVVPPVATTVDDMVTVCVGEHLQVKMADLPDPTWLARLATALG